MKKLLLLLCVFANVFSYYPHSRELNTEIIGSYEEGLYIPLHDFVFVGSKWLDGSPSLSYKSQFFPEADFTFVRDFFDYPISTEDYADWFTQKDLYSFPMKDWDFVNGMLLQKWENRDQYYLQLFFTRGREGFACIATLPKPATCEERLYFERLFYMLPQFIELVR